MTGNAIAAYLGRLDHAARSASIEEEDYRRGAMERIKLLERQRAFAFRQTPLTSGPYSLGGTHSVSNGVLLRRDIHSVFDAGYVTIDQSHRFVVSAPVKTDFNNGEEISPLAWDETFAMGSPVKPA
jgi:hypothetical protein